MVCMQQNTEDKVWKALMVHVGSHGSQQVGGGSWWAREPVRIGDAGGLANLLHQLVISLDLYGARKFLRKVLNSDLTTGDILVTLAELGWGANL